MNHLTLINHFFNFVAPAFGLALLLVAGAHVFMRKAASSHGWLAPIALVFIVGSIVLGLGELLLGSDGRMLTYAALVVAAATAYGLLLRGGR